MIVLEKWLVGSSMSWNGLRWGAAGLSLIVHGTAASIAWVSIETESVKPIDAYTVELVTLEQTSGSLKKQSMMSSAVPTDKAKDKDKTDIALGVTSAASSPRPVERKLQKQEPQKTTPLAAEVKKNEAGATA